MCNWVPVGGGYLAIGHRPKLKAVEDLARLEERRLQHGKSKVLD